MERICEPGLMDDPAQAAAYAAADFAAGDRAMVERIRELFAAEPVRSPAGPAGLGERIVDLGCGPGNITFLLAELLADRGPAARVIGIDGAGAMLAIAEGRRQALPHRWPALRFRHAALPLPELPADPLAGTCSAVVSNSLLHHLRDPQVLWRTVRLLAAPGAAIYLQDLRRPATPEAAQALVAERMGDAPELLRRDYLQSLHAAFTIGEVKEQLRRAELRGLRVGERGELYLEVWGRL